MNPKTIIAELEHEIRTKRAHVSLFLMTPLSTRLFSLVFIFLSSCAVRTWNSVERPAPPYEYDFGTVRPSPSVAALPVIIDQRIYQPAYRNALKPLVDSLNERLKTLEWLPATRALNISESAMPVLYFGTPENRDPQISNAPSAAVASKPTPMIIAHSAPTPEWKGSVEACLRELNADYLIFVTLGFSEYYMDRTFALKSRVYLGTDYTKPVTWIRNPEEPIQVLHLVGVLVDRSGTIVRVAAEGLIASETTGPVRAIVNQALGGKSVIREEEVTSLANRNRRTDISGEPLVLHVAIDNLLARLSGRVERVRRGKEE